MEKLVRFVKSHVICSIDGPDVERFLNMCRHQGIEFFNMTAVSGTLRASMSVDDFKKIRKMAVKTHTKVRILKRRGLRFILFRYRKRKGFAVGFLLFIGILYFLCSHIWTVDFQGNSNYTDEKLLKYLEGQGICPGTKVASVSNPELEENLRLTFPDISWVSVQIKGSTLRIQLEEMIKYEKADDSLAERTPCICAAVDGEIVSMVTRSGTPVADLSQTVSKGDILIDGYEDIMNDDGEVAERRMVGADGDVYAKTVEEYHEVYPAVNQVKRYESAKIRFYFKFGGKVLALQPGKLPEENYDIYTEVWTPLPELFPWLSLQKNYYRPYEEVPEFISLTQLADKASKDLEHRIEEFSEKGVQILENNVKIDTYGDRVEANGNFVVIKSIGEPSEYPQNGETDEYNGNDD